MSINTDLKICAGIVTFNPDIDRLKENYSNIAGQVDFVVICDNGSENIDEISAVLKGENDYIIKLKKNKGIAYALNQLCKYANNKGYNWIITLDQDSVCPPQMVETLSKYCNKITAVIGPRILYKGNEEYSANSEKRLEQVEWVITSGSLTNIDIWKKINGFDNYLFIDKVDTDYCVRADKAGYKVIRDNLFVLNHELGKMRCKKIFGRVIYITNHNYKRIYYQIRNSIILKKKIGYGVPLKDIAKIIIKVVLFEDNKILKMKSIIKGIINGIMYKA